MSLVLISCDSDGWTDKQESEFKSDCIKIKKGWDTKRCDCAFNQISKKYSYDEYSSTENIKLSSEEIDRYNKNHKEILEKCISEKTN